MNLCEEHRSLHSPNPKTFLIDRVISAKTCHLHNSVVSVIDANLSESITLVEFAIAIVKNEIALLGEWRCALDPCWLHCFPLTIERVHCLELNQERGLSLPTLRTCQCVLDCSLPRDHRESFRLEGTSAQLVHERLNFWSHFNAIDNCIDSRCWSCN